MLGSVEADHEMPTTILNSAHERKIKVFYMNTGTQKISNRQFVIRLQSWTQKTKEEHEQVYKGLVLHLSNR
jgi:hypothetical protein